MNVGELRELLAAYPDYQRVRVGSIDVTEVREQSIVTRSREAHGGQALDGAVVVVIA